MRHLRYPKLINWHNLKSKELPKVLGDKWDNRWEVTEKIHGSNFSFQWVGRGPICLASRNQFVERNFFGAGELLDPKGELCASVARLRADPELNRHHAITEDLATGLYGELFGDGIQRGVEYPPGKHFRAFDIVVQRGEGLKYPLPRASFYSLCERHGVPTVPLIQVGTFDEVIRRPPDLPTLTHASQSIMEGIVVRPSRVVYYWDEPLIIKVKSKAFLEMKPKATSHNLIASDQRVAAAINNAKIYLTRTRMDNVLSKYQLSENEGPNFKVWMRRLVADALNEYDTDLRFNEEPSVFGFDNKQKVQVEKGLSRAAAPLVRQALQDRGVLGPQN